MDSTTRFAAINTKARALIGKLLGNTDYLNLLSKKSVQEVASYLKYNTHYKDTLEGIDENSVHRSDLETLLRKSHVEGIEKIFYYFQDNYREFYKTLFIRYEIEDLKTIAKGIKTGSDNTELKDSLMYIGKFSDLNTDKLLSSRNVYDFLKNLKGTLYYDYIRPLVEGKESINFFSIEMTLDLSYFDMFYKNLKLIGKADRAIMEAYQGINVDMLNLQWIYRGLKFYSLPPEELFNYTIAYGDKYSRSDIKELCYSKSLDEFQKKVVNTKYSFLFDQENTKDMFMERRMLRYEYFTLKKIKRRDGMNISQAIVYSLLSEIEIRDIISVIENIRYEMPLEETKKFLIRKL